MVLLIPAMIVVGPRIKEVPVSTIIWQEAEQYSASATCCDDDLPVLLNRDGSVSDGTCVVEL